MDAAIEQFEMFPALASKVKAKSVFRQWLDAWAIHGPLMAPATAAVAMAVSRQRVHQLIETNRIATVVVAGQRMVPAAALELFLVESPRPGGRPKISEKFATSFRNGRGSRREQSVK